MSVWFVGGVSVGAIAAGFAFAGAFDHVGWLLGETARRRRARRRGGMLDLRGSA